MNSHFWVNLSFNSRNRWSIALEGLRDTSAVFTPVCIGLLIVAMIPTSSLPAPLSEPPVI